MHQDALFGLPTRLETFGREEFLANRWRYRPGEHVTVVGPTGCGKTHLTWQLLEQTATSKLPAVVLVKKARDPLITKRGKEMAYPLVKNWPPSTLVSKPAGWLLWPPTKFDPDIDRPVKAEIFRRAMLDAYRKGKRIIYADDAYGISELLGLRQVMIELWTEMRSMDGGVWAAFQKPSHVPRWAYSQAEHIFLFHDPDKRNRDNFAEIGGIAPDLVKDTVMGLQRHQCLYIRRDGGRACVVDR